MIGARVSLVILETQGLKGHRVSEKRPETQGLNFKCF